MWKWVAAAALIGGCGFVSKMANEPSGGGGAGYASARRVRVTIVSALIGPAALNGAEWDGAGPIPKDTADGLAASLTGGYAPVASFMARVAAAGLSAPDAFGYAELDRGIGRGYGERLPLATRGMQPQDTFTPSWPARPTWRGVELSNDTRIRVHVEDEDFTNHDPIGDCVLTGADLDAALRDGRVFHISVASQTYNQLLFVGIEVARD